MQEVSLQQILDAREARVILQKSLLNKHKVALICFTMNIAGPLKNSPLIERAFFEGIRFLENNIDSENIVYRKIDVALTGCQAVFCVSMDAQRLKSICTEIEDSCPLGRLFDMDVLDVNGEKLSRERMRGCIICGASGRECAAGRLHSVPELQTVTQKIIRDYFFVKDCKQFAEIATDSLLREVYTTPKPGLVDKRNNGSHTDMDIDTFIKSAHSLTPYFYDCVRIGCETSKSRPSETFEKLREIGIVAEKTMYRTTCGVNTHKGAIFSIGVLCGAFGRLWEAEMPVAKLEDVLSLCSEMAKEAVKSDFALMDKTTSGGRVYLRYGVEGIRGEVASGFPSVAKTALPVYRNMLGEGLDFNYAGVVTLIHLIATVKDTNLYHRGGSEGACFAADCAKRLLKKSSIPSKEEIERLDDEFIARNLSPGGCADLLAITYFLHKMDSYK